MRTKKAIKNAVVSAVYQLIAVICGLITPRLILAAFGSTYNGVISSANQFLEMISFLTLGIAGATRAALHKPLADGDMLSVSRIMKSNKRYMHKVGIAIIFFAVALCAVYPVVSHNDLTRAENAALIAIVSVGVFAQYFFGISNQTLLSADQSGYVYYFIQTVSIVANTIVSVALIKLNYSIFAVKAGSSVVFLVSPVILNYVVKRKYNLIQNCDPDDTAIQQRGAVAFHSIANIVHEDTDLIVLTLFADAKLISVYTVYQLVVCKVRRILLMLANGLEGAFGNMWAKNEKKAFERNFRLVEYIIFTNTSIVFSCVSVLIIPFVRLYTSGVHDVNYIRVGFALLTVITEAMHCIREPYLIIVQATGNYEATKKGAMYEALINISLSLCLVHFMGLSGVMFGTLVANTFRTVQYAFFISRNIIKGSIRVTICRFIWFLCNSAIVVFTQGCILDLLPPAHGWNLWITHGVAAFFVAATLTLITSLLFCRYELDQVVRLIKTALQNHK